ncbi:MAG: DNA polymerase III subunit delta [Defluviitaleaceae bacterium]|nr:DNA polymerase III subunit delta [Defluviitaleaceae bacterium]MCL2264047.1 DNA polymerase III subunit delta [Defluviitaleaceae bacterium]
MEQKKLKAELSRGELKRTYLLHGKEKFLVSHYAREIEKICGAKNKDLFDGAIPAEQIIMAAETLPFSFDAAEKRLIIVRDSKLFAMAKKGDESETETETASGRKADSEKMAEYLPKIPQDTVIIFIESDVDKRTRLYKKVAELDGVVDFAPLAPHELTKWISHHAKQHGKQFSAGAAELLLRTCGTDMFNLKNETDKLIHHSGNTSNEITRNDIAEICTPTLESRIFDLLKAMGNRRTSAALKMYNDMLTLKESPFMILAMIIRQLRITLLCKCLAEKNTPRPQIVKELKLHEFAISEAISQGRGVTSEKLISALENCQNTDIRIKSGLITAEIGVEMLVMSQ